MEKAVKGISDEERGKTRFDDRYRCQPHPDFRDKEENKKQRSYTNANTSLIQVVRDRGSLWKWSSIIALIW